MKGLEMSYEADLPRRVKGVEVQDPMFSVFGEAWSLAISCPWYGSINDVEVNWEDDNIEDTLWDLIGMDLIGVRQYARRITFDFTHGHLTAEPDTYLDPWVLSLPSGITVGSLL